MAPKDRAQRLVAPSHPGTILLKEELEKLAGQINQKVTLVVGSYEYEDDGWNHPTTESREILLEGLLGYSREKDYVLTHLIGTEKNISGSENEPVLYVLTAWHDLIERVESAVGDILFENAHYSFYYRTVDGEPAPGLYDSGRDFHSSRVKARTLPKPEGKNNYLLSEKFLASKEFYTRDLGEHDLVRMDLLVIEKEQ